MKKFLSVLLAAMMVLPTIAMAAPSAVTSFDTAKEETENSTTDAELSANTFDTYNIKYFALGNSYLKYDYSSEAHVDWWMRNSAGGIDDPRGMAASTSANDYFHKIQEYVKADLEGQAEVVFEATALSVAGPEKSWQYSGLNGNYTGYDYDLGAASVDSNEVLNKAFEQLAEYNPNVVTLQIGENTGFTASNDCKPIAAWFYDKIVGKIRTAAPDAIIVVVTVFEPGVVYNGIMEAYNGNKYTNFKESNRVFISDNSDMVIPDWMIGNPNYPEYNDLLSQKTYTNPFSSKMSDYRYNHEYLAYQQYPNYDQVMLDNPGATDFRAHPGDKGMAEIGRRAATVLSEKIPLYLTPDSITIPDTLGGIQYVAEYDAYDYLDGTDKVVAFGGPEKHAGRFYLNPSAITPEEASKEVVWSIDNEEIATGVVETGVVETGEVDTETKFFVVTPKRNGRATLTVQSKYDASVKSTIEIEVKGQAPHFTLTYDLGAADANNEPEPYMYAAEDYTFPAPTVRPTRPGYKFAGWSETLGGKAVDSVYMNEDTTVYAVWEFAHDWQFNKDGDTEGIQTTGMHGKTEGGYFIAETYDSGAGSISATDLRISSDNYQTFKTRMSLSEVKTGDRMVLEVGTVESDTNYRFEAPLTSTVLTEYTFDLSSIVNETIDYFIVGSSNSDIPANRITVDYATFVESKVAGDRDFENHTASGVEVYNSGNYKYTFTNLIVASGASIYFGTGNYYINGLTNNGTITAAPDANVVITSGKVEGYVEIDIGIKTNVVRYAEVNGIEHKIAESSGNKTYGMIVSNDVDRLLVIKDGSNTKVYFVDAVNKTATPIEALSNYMKATIGAKEFGENGEKYGAKFETEVAISAKADADYVITEYGYIVSLDELLGAQQLNFDVDETKYAYGAAYVKGVSDKVVYDANVTNATQQGFRAVIYGATTGEMYGKKLVVKTYTKIATYKDGFDVFGNEAKVIDNEFVIYGPTQYESFYSLAEKLGDENEIAKAIKDATKAETDEPSLDFGDLLG